MLKTVVIFVRRRRNGAVEPACVLHRTFSLPHPSKLAFSDHQSAVHFHVTRLNFINQDPDYPIITMARDPKWCRANRSGFPLKAIRVLYNERSVHFEGTLPLTLEKLACREDAKEALWEKSEL